MAVESNMLPLGTPAPQFDFPTPLAEAASSSMTCLPRRRSL